MVKEILYSTAEDETGQLIHVINAEKGKNYYCPLCKSEFILNKSGRTGRGSRRPHFSHNHLTSNCTPEGVLHYSFKMMLINLLENYKAEKSPFIINWACDSCDYNNSGNLLAKTATILEEYDLKVCRPDIALLNKEGNVLAAIEIVVTHEPGDIALHYYKENKIILIRINLTTEEDLIYLEERAKNPDIVSLCLSPKCQNRDKYEIKREIKASQSYCGLCHYPIVKFHLEVESVLGRTTSYDFTNDEINLVKASVNKKGIRLKTETNQAKNENYPIVDCLNCLRINSKYKRFKL